MITQTDILSEMERYRSLRREADLERLIRQAHSKTSTRRQISRQLLARIGAQLRTWGEQLEQKNNPVYKPQ